MCPYTGNSLWFYVATSIIWVINPLYVLAWVPRSGPWSQGYSSGQTDQHLSCFPNWGCAGVLPNLYLSNPWGPVNLNHIYGPSFHLHLSLFLLVGAEALTTKNARVTKLTNTFPLGTHFSVHKGCCPICTTQTLEVQWTSALGRDSLYFQRV
jgi:hypothetical protein